MMNLRLLLCWTNVSERVRAPIQSLRKTLQLPPIEIEPRIIRRSILRARKKVFSGGPKQETMYCFRYHRQEVMKMCNYTSVEMITLTSALELTIICIYGIRKQMLTTLYLRRLHLIPSLKVFKRLVSCVISLKNCPLGYEKKNSRYTRMLRGEHSIANKV